MALGIAVATSFAAASPAAATAPVAKPGPAASVRVVVRETAPSSNEAERLVRRLGGTVNRQLPIVGGFSARVPRGALARLRSARAIRGMWPDAALRMADIDLLQYDSHPVDQAWRAVIRAPNNTGAGVTVAVLDTGVRQTPDLGQRVLARVDLTPDASGYDRFGHGTHMAGVIAGDGTSSAGQWTGVAPGANLVSIKVASFDGATDVSAVIAGLQWVVANRVRFGIRILNLSFGTDARQSYLLDPLDYAIEQVWRSGVLVVTAAGNRGPDRGTITKPGDDPYAVTVGAADTNGTVTPADDVVAPFSSRGPTADWLSKPDLVAPGIAIVSNRATGSTLDVARPAARVGEVHFRGTGTSQATAIVSGVAALILEANPSLTPALVKALLMETANKGIAGQPGAGAGMVDATRALELSTKAALLPATNQGLVPSTGEGRIESSRGSMHVYADVKKKTPGPELVEGETDVLGNYWSALTYAKPWTAYTWLASPWYSITAEAAGWGPSSPTGSWGGMTWTAGAWVTASWSSESWSCESWSAESWSARYWSTWN